MINQKNGENVVDKRVLVPMEIHAFWREKKPKEKENLPGSANNVHTSVKWTQSREGISEITQNGR